MLLAIDARNREVAIGLRDGSGWKAVRRFGAECERSADEYAQLMCLVAAEASGTAAAPFTAQAGIVGEAWISSVVPALTRALAKAVLNAFGVEASIVGPGVRTGVRIRTDNPSEVGSDIVCAAAAAREIAGGACVVVDFGTAITVSAVDGAGDLLGVAIAPGIASAASALRSSTAQIPEVRLEMPRRAIGKNTAQAVQAGILLGYSGLVDRLIGLQRGELSQAAREGAKEGRAAPAEAPAVIGTGDEAGEAIMEACGFDRFVPDLVLEGLALIASRSPRTGRSRESESR